MIIIVHKDGCIKAALLTVAELMSHIKTTKDVAAVYKVSGEVSDDCLDVLQGVRAFDQEVVDWFSREYGLAFHKLDILDLVAVGSRVITRCGDEYEVTRIYGDRQFLYQFDGIRIGSPLQASWTADGFYYNQNNPSGRDIIEVRYA